ncbi:MAG: hypothetical protein WCP04_12480 [Pseudomonadota bacterium]
MSLQPIVAILALPVMLFAAYAALRRDLLRTALALVVATPLVAGLIYLGAGHQWTHSATTAAPTPESSAETVATAQNPSPSAAGSGKVSALRTQAEAARRAKNYAEAATRFREITQAAPFDPDGWADLGDAQAAAAGGDLAAGETAIDRALELDGDHAKALWLKASLELQGKHYKAAADRWRRLLKALPADSSDAKIVQTNLEEAERLASGPGASP